MRSSGKCNLLCVGVWAGACLGALGHRRVATNLGIGEAEREAGDIVAGLKRWVQTIMRRSVSNPMAGQGPALADVPALLVVPLLNCVVQMTKRRTASSSPGWCPGRRRCNTVEAIDPGAGDRGDENNEYSQHEHGEGPWALPASKFR